jgi:uncharacterized membrane protein
VPQRRQLLLVLLLLFASAPAWAATPTILPCHQDEILALLDPYGGERDIVPGWRCTGIAISDVVDITLSRGDDRISVVLHDPAWAGDAAYRSTHYRMTVSAGPALAATEVARVGSALSAIIAGNDRRSFWYQAAYSPFPIDRGPTCVSSRSLLVVGLVLLAAAAVTTHWLLRARRANRVHAESLAKLSRQEWAVLLLTVMIAAMAYLTPSYLRFTRYGINSADFGIYAHSFWNAWQGHGLFNSPEGLDHLSSHASPGLYLLVPLYALAPSPLTLLVLNGLALVSGAIPAYLIARRQLGALPSLLCAAIYLMNPALGSLNYDVHEISFAVPLLLWTLLFLQQRRTGLMLITLALAVLWKENVGVTAVFVGAYALVVQRRVHLGVALILLGLAWAFAGINVIVPYFGGSHANKTMMRYAALGNDWGELLLSPLLRPGVFFATVFSADAARYLFKVLSPFGLLPLLSPAELLIATPTVAEAILDGPGELRSGLYHYEALLLPVLYVAFVAGVVRVSALASQPARARIVLLVLILLTQPFHRSAGRGLLADTSGDPARAEIDAVIARIPAGASVISPQNIQPHVSDRRVSAYFNTDKDLRGEYSPFDYAVLPATVEPPPMYERLVRGSAYSLFKSGGRTSR